MNDFERLMQLLAVLTTMGGIGTVLFIGTRYALAKIRRMEHQGDDARLEASAETSARLSQLEQEIAELHERLDFTERVLGRSAEAERLQPGRDIS